MSGESWNIEKRHTLDPADLPKYFISPAMPNVRVPNASMDCISASGVFSVVGAGLLLNASAPNLIKWQGMGMGMRSRGEGERTSERGGTGAGKTKRCG